MKDEQQHLCPFVCHDVLPKRPKEPQENDRECGYLAGPEEGTQQGS